MATPGNPGGPPGYELTWERCSDRTPFPGGAPPGWGREYDPNQFHRNASLPNAPLEPQVRPANAPGEPVRSQQHSVRFQLYRGDKRVNCGVRSELSGDHEPAGAERWYGFSVYLPRTWTPDPADESVTQWHQVTESGSPPLALLTKQPSTDTAHSHWFVGQREWGVGAAIPENVILHDAGRCALGEWTDWVFHVRWSPDPGAGRLEVWKNGASVAPFVPGFRTRTTFAAGSRHYIKIGIYKYRWNVPARGDVTGHPCGSRPADTSNQLRRCMYHDELRIVDQTGDRTTVAPRGPRPTPVP